MKKKNIQCYSTSKHIYSDLKRLHGVMFIRLSSLGGKSAISNTSRDPSGIFQESVKATAAVVLEASCFTGVPQNFGSHRLKHRTVQQHLAQL